MDTTLSASALVRSSAMPTAILDTHGRGDNADAYVAGYRIAGADPFVLPDDVGAARRQLGRAKALVVAGVPRDGRDVDPAIYGGERDPLCGPTDRVADERQLAVIEAALQWRLPVIATCLGMHLVVCALGGRLIQHVDGHASHDPGRETVETGIAITGGSALAGMVGLVSIVRCMHHQAVDPDALPASLAVTASSGDRIVHALEGDNIALEQHHSERDLTGDGLRVMRARVEAARTVGLVH